MLDLTPPRHIPTLPKPRSPGVRPGSRLSPDTVRKSKVAGLKIFRENTKQRAIANSYDLNRVTDGACEFCVRS